MLFVIACSGSNACINLVCQMSCISSWYDGCGPAPCSDLTAEQRRLAEITEMIHTASLVHDDVLDECSVRRGTPLCRFI